MQIRRRICPNDSGIQTDKTPPPCGAALSEAGRLLGCQDKRIKCWKITHWKLNSPVIVISTETLLARSTHIAPKVHSVFLSLACPLKSLVCVHSMTSTRGLFFSSLPLSYWNSFAQRAWSAWLSQGHTPPVAVYEWLSCAGIQAQLSFLSLGQLTGITYPPEFSCGITLKPALYGTFALACTLVWLYFIPCFASLTSLPVSLDDIFLIHLF